MARLDEAQEQIVFKRMIEGYKKLTPQYQKVVRAMVNTLLEMQEYASLPELDSDG